MQNVADYVTLAAIVVAWTTLWRLRRATAGTTLITAWWCCVIALAGWSIAWFVPIDPLAGHVWYWIALLTLLPFVAILGARRPIDRAWPWFVLLPCCLVLSLPSISTLWRGTHLPLRLETPTVIGFGFVLTMGVGNYLFTRLAIPALLVGTAIGLLVYPVTEFGINAEASLPVCILYAALCLGTAAVIGHLLTGRRTTAASPHDQLWIDFRNAYGIVWTKRVMDRVNWTATEENWPLRLDLFGIVWTNDRTTDDERNQTTVRLETTFRWLLKRFVDEAWIDQRVESGKRKAESGTSHS